MAFAVAGLTGGIGSGKSTVAAMFSELGVPVVDADRVARDVVEPGTDGLAAVVEAFGDGMLGEDGRLDRAKLGERVFDDEAARRRLEGILHPRIAAASMARFAQLAEEGHPYAIYEAALLVESGRHRMMGALIVVAVDEATQVARVEARDALSAEAARKRIAAQLPLAEKVDVADYVIRNDGDRDETRAQVREVHASLLERFGGKP
ncbi:MAG: dephospho-CoA kinase [Sandaracinaceae bacterium]|nr:dephospho-CoA kinase [Myxococcales bacterium]